MRKCTTGTDNPAGGAQLTFHGGIWNEDQWLGRHLALGIHMFILKILVEMKGVFCYTELFPLVVIPGKS